MRLSFVLAVLFFKLQTYAAINPHAELPGRDVVVAIIDTGADLKHRELQDYIWTNPGEFGLDQNGNDKSNNGVDDDDNGFVDDLHGWNFVDNKPQVEDSNGHGTHIAGIIKGESSKNSPDGKSHVRLMILKYYNPEGTDTQNIENTVKAINYAVKMKARVINYSGGGSLPNTQELEALKKAEKARILVVAAAGNNNNNTDLTKYFPANYPLKNIISVAATNNTGELVAFSNYGPQSIEVAAPGERILSSLPGGKYGFMSGTSQATAYVSGFVARQLASRTITPTSDEMLFKILDRSSFKNSLAGKTKFQMALLD